MATRPFFISDTSPVFTYSDGWTPAYHPTEAGYDETFHQTTLKTDIVSFNITASSLHFSTPHSDATPPTCDVQYRLDGSEWKDGCDMADLSNDWHGVEIRPKGDGGLQFLGVRGKLRLGEENKHHNITIDNLSSQFTYSAAPSAWTLINSAGPLGEVQNQTAANTFGDKGGFFSQSLAMSTAQGAKAELKFTGEAVYLYGLSGPEMGMGEIALDGKTMPSTNMTLPWRSYSSLLFMAGDLDANVEHTLSFTNSVAGRTAVIDYAVVTLPGDNKSSPNLGLILGAAAGGVTATLFICVVLYCLISRRRRRTPPSPRRTGSKSGSGYTTDTTSDTPRSIDEWRKQSGGAGSPISPVSITFSEGSRSTAQLVRLNQTPPPDYTGTTYPDYIPYNGPIEPRPPIPALVFQSPSAVGGSPGAPSWLQSRTNSVASRAPSPAGIQRVDSARSLTSPSSSLVTSSPGSTSSPSPPSRLAHPVRTGSRESTATLDVPFTASDYYSRRDAGRAHSTSPNDVRMSEIDLLSLPSSATPTRPWAVRDPLAPPSTAGSDVASLRSATIGTVTTSRLEGSQSVARVWPARAGGASTSSVLDSSPPSALDPENTIMFRGAPSAFNQGQNMQPRHPTGRTPPNLPRIASSGGFSHLYAAYGGTASQPSSAGPSTAQSRSTGGRYLPSAIPSSAALPTSYPHPSPTLRRGPSIKSVKTVRSFFSGLLASGDAPAVPRYYEARPDSDLFGDSISVKRRPSVHEGASYGRSGLRPQMTSGVSTAGASGGSRHAPQPLRLIGDEGESPGPRNMFIELDPNSPMTVVSRPGSEQPMW